MTIQPYYVSYRLKLAYHALTTALESAVRPLGVTLTQVNALLIIDRFAEATMPRLAEHAGVSLQAMHRTVISLEKRELVIRQRKEGNDKTFFLYLTPEGEALLRQAETLVTQAQSAMLEQFSNDELHSLQLMLEKFERAFKS